STRRISATAGGTTGRGWYGMRAIPCGIRRLPPVPQARLPSPTSYLTTAITTSRCITGFSTAFPRRAGKFFRETTSRQHTNSEPPPSRCIERAAVLWIAWEEGREQGGRDYGTLVRNRGKPLYNGRNARVVCLQADGKLTRPVADLPVSRYDPPMAGDAKRT